MKQVFTPRRGSALLAVAGCIAFLALSLHAAKLETPTVDEFAHVPAGCVYLRHGTFELFAKNPPLLKMLMACAVLSNGDVVVPEPNDLSQGWGPWTYGLHFMAKNRPRYFDLFFSARLVVVLCGLGTGGLLFLWASQVFDRRSAAISCTLFLLTPVVLAHSHLATTDVGCMFTIFLSAYLLRCALVRPTWLRFVATGLAWGAALLVKFTAVLLAPAILILILAVRWQNRGRAVLELGLVVVCALLIVNLGMGCQGSFQPLGNFDLQSSFCKSFQDHLPEWLPVPLPQPYLIGFDALKLDVEQGEFGGYLLGEWSQQGWWYYDLVAFAVKNPLPSLLLLAVCPWFLVRSDVVKPERLAFVVPLVVVLVLMIGFNRVQTGIRYLLPSMPFLYLALTAIWSGLRGRWATWLPATVMGWYVVTVAVTHPSYISYFNLAAGGETNGHRILAASNLDWGQDLYRLMPAVESLQREGAIGLLYFGHVHPGLYGIEYQLVPNRPVEGLLAVSVNYLLGSPYPAMTADGRMIPIEPDHLEWLRSHEPTLRLGSIWVFDTRNGQ